MSKGDYFLVVQTIETGKPVLTVVPHKWVCGNTLLWPNKQANELRKNAASTPSPSWIKMSCSIKRKFIPTFSEAEQEADDLSGQSTDASDFVVKRRKTAKTASIKKPLDLNHMINDNQVLEQATQSVAQKHPSNVVSTDPRVSVVAQPVEQIYCHPDMNNLLEKTQGPGLISQSAPITDASNTLVAPMDTMVTEGYVVNIQQPDADRIIREVSDKIEQVCTRVATEATNSVLGSIQVMLAKTSMLEMKIDAVSRSNTCLHDQEPSSSFQFSPVTTIEGLDNLEENLENDVYAKQLFAYMKRIIGHSGDDCNGLNIAYGLVDHIFDRKLMLVCSWTGESKGETTKE
ncbi:uncharacterized protein LOC134218484 [Armigeres subalbatus]|uniref:uncharacterized protein LOC134218484 n=1 Tax=Armigeres subalbatus TaxID=124917 RepID=UPI002ED5C823